jgi:spectinomycin phosphotransferase
MLEKPKIQEDAILACIQEGFGLNFDQISFLPLGADVHTAVYRVLTPDQTPYFLKLRSGDFNDLSVRLPKFLNEQGIAEIISPLSTKTGDLWVSLANFKLILYPFIEGDDAFEVHLSDLQWRQFGAALKAVHTAVLPAALAAQISQETYSPKWRQIVTEFMQRIQSDQFAEPVAVRMAAFLNTKRDEVDQLLQRTKQLAQVIQNLPLEFVLCHADVHAWNVLIATDGTFYIVDWDDPVLAPKERDLMFIGAGLGNIWNTAREEALFYGGYGEAKINQSALAYYRCERIIQDIAAYCEQIFLTDDGGQDRGQAFQQVTLNFLPGLTIDIALQTGLPKA